MTVTLNPSFIAATEPLAEPSKRACSSAGRLVALGADRVAARITDVELIAPRPVTGSSPSVTVVIPCYNYGHYLPGCLESVLSQPGVRVDVIVVDDASPDGSGDRAAAMTAGDGRVQVIRHRVNAGHIATYNDGLDRATGDYVVLLSADDLLTPGALRRATELMEHCPSVGFTYGRVATFSDMPTFGPDLAPEGWAVWSGSSWLARRWRSGRNCIWSPEVVMRRSVQRQIGVYRADLPHTADLDMWMRTAAVSDVGYVLGTDQAAYRVHAANMHAQSFQGQQAEGILIDLRERLRTFETFSGELPKGIGRHTARQALSREALVTAARPRSRHLPDAQVMEQLRAFATEVDPLARGSHRWRVAERRLWMARHGINTGSQAFGVLEAVDRANGKVLRWPWERVGA